MSNLLHVLLVASLLFVAGCASKCPAPPVVRFQDNAIITGDERVRAVYVTDGKGFAAYAVDTTVSGDIGALKDLMAGVIANIGKLPVSTQVLVK